MKRYFFHVRNGFLTKIGILVLICKIIISLLLGLEMCWNSPKHRNTKFLPAVPTGSVPFSGRAELALQWVKPEPRQAERQRVRLPSTRTTCSGHMPKTLLCTLSTRSIPPAWISLQTTHRAAVNSNSNPTTQWQVIMDYAGFIPDGHH